VDWGKGGRQIKQNPLHSSCSKKLNRKKAQEERTDDAKLPMEECPENQADDVQRGKPSINCDCPWNQGKGEIKGGAREKKRKEWPGSEGGGGGGTPPRHWIWKEGEKREGFSLGVLTIFDWGIEGKYRDGCLARSES